MKPSTDGLAAREKSAFWDGLRASTPTIPGLFAWGVVTGMAMIQSGLSMWQALMMTFMVYAGSAQLAVLPLIAADAPATLIFLTALMVNLRFVIFSAVVGPHFSYLPWYERIYYGYFNADVVMAFFPQRFPVHTLAKSAGKLGFYSGLATSNWSSWQAGSLLGLFMASQIPTTWGIGFAGTLALLTITVPLVINWAALTGVVVAGASAVLAMGLPYRLGLVLAMVLGIAAAMAVDHIKKGSTA